MPLNTTPWRSKALARLAAAAAASVVTLSLGAGLLGAFHASSPPRWLPASPALLAELARCDDRAGRADREHCRQQVAQRGLEPADTSVRLAAGEPPAAPGAWRGRP
jgi:hypothetical protein